MAKDENKQKKEISVVAELPTQAVREATDGEKEYEFVTTEEALTEILLTVRHLKKALG